MSYPIVYIGSNIESKFGIGTLFKWKAEELADIHYDVDDGWVVVNKQGEKFYCYDLIKVETSLGGELEMSDLFADEFVFEVTP